ncbi:MAG TPA: hypothetical protein VF951_03510 [Streptosporangiaceae bacterium]
MTLTDLSPMVRRGVTAADRYITQITPEAVGWADAKVDPRLPMTTAGGRR